MELKELINKQVFSPEDILRVISIIGQNRDVIIIKNDGIRDTNQYTAIIIPSINPEKSLRCDSNSLEEAVKNVLKKYVNQKYFFY